MNARKTIGRLAAAASLALLAGWTAAPAHAITLDFTLYNVSGRSIHNLYVTPANEPYCRDVLGRGVLLSGESTRITFPGQNSSSPCLWDVKVVYSDRTYAENRFDLCAEGKIYAR